MLPAEFVATTAAMILHGHGDTRTPLLAGVVGSVVNVLVNAACIFGISIGPLTMCGTTREALTRLVRLGAPGILERLVVHAGFRAFVKVMTSLSELEMATNQALITIESICFLGADGFGVAAATVMGQRLGADDPVAARHGGLIATGLAVTAISGIGLGLWLFEPVLLPVSEMPSEGQRSLPKGCGPCPCSPWPHRS